MNGYLIEDKLNKIAEGIASEYRSNGSIDLESLVKTASDRHMLNSPEIETLNAKVNHLVFKEKFAEDKLSTFKISKFENILKVDRAMNIVEYKVAMYDDANMSKAAEEEYEPGVRDIEDVKITPQNAPLLMEAGEENVNQIRDLYQDREKELQAIKNRAIALLKEGESLNDIYAVLKDTWGSDNKDELDTYFQQLITELKQDGYLSADPNYDPATGAMQTEDNEPLKQASHRLMKIGQEIMLRESAHDIIINKLAGDYEFMAEKLENRMPDNYYGTSYALYRGISTMSKQASIGSAIKGGFGKFISNPVGKAIAVGAGVGGTLSLLSQADVANDAIRKKVWERKLKSKYPELNDIPEDKYKDIYGSLVGLEPQLLKAPYALKEMIMAHNQYGTIDSNTTIKLLASGRNAHPIMGQIASPVGKAVAFA